MAKILASYVGIIIQKFYRAHSRQTTSLLPRWSFERDSCSFHGFLELAQS